MIARFPWSAAEGTVGTALIDELLDRLIAQGRALPAANLGPIPPTPPRADRDAGISLSAALAQTRDDERY